MNSSEENREFETRVKLLVYMNKLLVAITNKTVKQIKGTLEKLKF